MKITYFVFACLLIQLSEADWFSDFIDLAQAKIADGATFLKEKAAPAVREKFTEIKQTLQDPETHRKAKEWIQESAVPAIKKPLNAAGEFIEKEVAPEVKKVVDAAKEGLNGD